jgi:hypothetical protein
VGVGTVGGAIDLQDIKCGEGCSDSVSFSVLNAIGIGGDSYYWINWYENPDTGDTEACWVDGAYEKVEGFTIQPGQGLWVAGDSADQLFQSAGMVGTSDVAVQLRYGSTLTGNPTPVAVDLQDIRCGEGCSDSVSFSILNAIAIGGDSYYWINWYENPDTGETESCWVDGAYEKVEGFTVQPGEGLWVAGDDNTQYIIFPGVEL